MRLGGDGFPWLDANIKLVKSKKTTEHSIDAAIGLMSMHCRLIAVPENKFGDELRKRRKELAVSTINPDFQVILIGPAAQYLMCKVYPKRDS